LLTLSAKIKLQLPYVPMTLQTLVALLIGAAYGWRLGVTGDSVTGWRRAFHYNIGDQEYARRGVDSGDPPRCQSPKITAGCRKTRSRH
jgi:hypothetical protein